MTSAPIQFTLSYTGNDSDRHEIDLYDVGQALIGFQRSLALTTHLILSGEVITQAPSLKGARIVALPSKKGSWEQIAKILLVSGSAASAIYALGTAPQNTPLGHLVGSAYDYVISESLGFHVDYEKTLGQQYEELKMKDSPLPNLKQSQFDSVIEKCDMAITQMHRPIISSKSANEACISYGIGDQKRRLRTPLNNETHEFIHKTFQGDTTEKIIGRVSSYNINTYKGRIFIPEEGRPIPFELIKTTRDIQTVSLIADSLTKNLMARFEGPGNIECVVYKNRSQSGRLKNLLIMEVSQ